MSLHTRIQKLEKYPRKSELSSDGFSINEELSRDDPERLALFLAAMKRSRLLDKPPAPEDDSQLAQFIRLAAIHGLITFPEADAPPASEATPHVLGTISEATLGEEDSDSPHEDADSHCGGCSVRAD